MNRDVIIIGLFLLAQPIIGVFFSRRTPIKNEVDFLLGGRNLGIFLTTFTLFATWFGAETSLGTASNIYQYGLSGGRIDPFGYTISLLLMGFILAKKFRELNLTTMADLFALRYGKLTEKISVFLLVPSTLIWTAAQLKAFGYIMNQVIVLPMWLHLLIGLVIILTYTLFGGFLGSVWTDLFQAIFLIVGLVFIFVMTMRFLPQPMVDLQNIAREGISFYRKGETWWENLNGWAVPILGSFTSQEMISRILATKDSKIAVKSLYLASFMYLLVGMIPVILGFLTPSILGHSILNIVDTDQILPQLAGILMPSGFALLFQAALISAVLSTADSSILTVSGLFSHNLIPSIFPVMSEQKKLLCNRIVLLGCGVITYILAINSDKIIRLLEIASSFGTSGVLIITLVALFKPQWCHAKAAQITLVTGISAQLVLEHLLHIPGSYLINIILCFFTYFLSRFNYQ